MRRRPSHYATPVVTLSIGEQGQENLALLTYDAHKRLRFRTLGALNVGIADDDGTDRHVLDFRLRLDDLGAVEINDHVF